jgi:hypothetical protein
MPNVRVCAHVRPVASRITPRLTAVTIGLALAPCRLMDALPFLPALEGHLALLRQPVVALLDLLQAELGLVAATCQSAQRRRSSDVWGVVGCKSCCALCRDRKYVEGCRGGWFFLPSPESALLRLIYHFSNLRMNASPPPTPPPPLNPLQSPPPHTQITSCPPLLNPNDDSGID